MKTKAIVSILILTLVVLIVAGSCATRKIAISEEDLLEAFSGIWINTDYEFKGDVGYVQKFVWYPDGRYEGYSLVTHEAPAAYGRYEIIDMWKDSNGDIWYTLKAETPLSKGYYMGRISDSGNTHETLFNRSGEPIEEWDPDHVLYRYWIHYRQE
jgi:hypothetical protein